LVKPLCNPKHQTIPNPHQNLSFTVQDRLHFAATTFHSHNPSPWIALGVNEEYKKMEKLSFNILCGGVQEESMEVEEEIGH